MDIIPQIVSLHPRHIRFLLRHCYPKRRFVFGRLVFINCAAFHLIACISHRIPWYVVGSPSAQPTLTVRGSAYWCEYPELFAAIASAKPGEERALTVLRWFIVRLESMVKPNFDFKVASYTVEHA